MLMISGGMKNLLGNHLIKHGIKPFIPPSINLIGIKLATVVLFC